MNARTPLGEFEPGQVVLHRRGRCVAVVTASGLQTHNMHMPTFSHADWTVVDPERLEPALQRQLVTARRMATEPKEWELFNDEE